MAARQLRARRRLESVRRRGGGGGAEEGERQNTGQRLNIVLTPGLPLPSRPEGGTCCRELISRSTRWFVSGATVSLWHIEDVRNEAQSGIKGLNGKQLILLEPPGGRALATPWYWTERGFTRLSRSHYRTSAGKEEVWAEKKKKGERGGGVGRGGGLGENICVAWCIRTGKDGWVAALRRLASEPNGGDACWCARQEGRRCWIKWSSDVSDGTTWWIKKKALGWASAYPDPGNFVGKHETVAHFWKLSYFLKVPSLLCPCLFDCFFVIFVAVVTLEKKPLHTNYIFSSPFTAFRKKDVELFFYEIVNFFVVYSNLNYFSKIRRV